MGVLDERMPLTGWQGLDSDAPVGQLAVTAAAVHIGAGVPGIVQDPGGAVQGQGSPAQLPLAAAGREPRGEEQALLPEVLDGGAHGPGAGEGPEEQPYALLDLQVGIQHHLSVRGVDHAYRQRTAQLAAARLVEQAAAQTSPQHVQLRLAHGALQPQQQAVVEMGRVVDAILVENERVGEGADLQQPVPVGRIARQP